MEPLERNVDLKLAEFSSSYESSAKLSRPWYFRIQDIRQQIFILVNNILIAGPSKSHLSGHCMEVVPNRTLDSDRSPVIMGLNRSKILSCMKSGEGPPQLQLVTGDVMDLYEKHEESLEFTFYTQPNVSETTWYFESAAFPGWFLSTSPEPYKPLRLSQGDNSDTTLFYLKKRRICK
ncbi:interleukin-36 receptor antagonist protein-like isoform X2 [Sphaerodactylus townsendi]|uniref:interleukin-36 receptor antagonist protein-like isoform X2 n=1 Tax=Sphaerodactylus townsendi TaxID=933632 RepID=UPI002026B991|nr:interleukin-36 receptor antagonist protein-like isoform X2 [Sphaerodactylus townsendi]